MILDIFDEASAGRRALGSCGAWEAIEAKALREIAHGRAQTSAAPLQEDDFIDEGLHILYDVRRKDDRVVSVLEKFGDIVHE